MANGLLTPSVSVQVKGQTITPTDITITNQVNALATVRVVGNYPSDGAGGVAKLDMETLSGKVGALQDYIMNTPRIVPDMVVDITDDGQGGSLTFNGFLSSPSMAVAAGSVAQIFSGVHSSAVLDFFDGSVYSLYSGGQPWVPDTGLVSDTGAAYAAVNTKGSITLRLKVMLAYFTSEAVVAEALNYLPTNVLAIRKATVTRNALILPLVNKFLDGSNNTTKDANIDALPTALSNNMRVYLAGLLHRGSSLFSAIINELCPAFCMQYVCDIAGDQAILSWLDYTNATPVKITVPASSVSFSAGGNFDLPIKGVVINCHATVNTATNAVNTPNQFVGAVASFPTDAQAQPGARYPTIDGPPWLSIDTVTIDTPKATTQTRTALADLKTGMGSIGASLSAAEGYYAGILNAWAERKFYALSLLSSSAMLKLPLSVGLAPGQVYAISIEGATVTNQDGSPGAALFTGYAETVTHHISVQNGGGSAETVVYFSHVKINGYTAPTDGIGSIDLGVSPDLGKSPDLGASPNLGPPVGL